MFRLTKETSTNVTYTTFKTLTKKCLSDSPSQVALQQLRVNPYKRFEFISIVMMSIKRNRMKVLFWIGKWLFYEQHGKWSFMQLCCPSMIKRDWKTQEIVTVNSILTVSWITSDTKSFWRNSFLYLSMNCIKYSLSLKTCFSTSKLGCIETLN